MKKLDVGPLSDRCKIVVVALCSGWDLVLVNGRNYLIDPDPGHEPVYVPNDVMNKLVADEILDFNPTEIH